MRAIVPGWRAASGLKPDRTRSDLRRVEVPVE
jgi:hypothetical protein